MDIQDFRKSTKIVIIDDNEDEGKMIKTALESKDISSVFYHIKTNDDLPEIPFQNLRVIFLDLNFAESSGFARPEQTAGIALSKLSRFIAKDSFYILIIWSSHTDQEVYTKFCEQLQRDSEIQKPIRIFPMSKDIGSDSNLIIETINQGFQDIPLFRTFIEWENMVSTAISKSLSSVIPGTTDNTYLSKLLNSLGTAYSGGEHPKISTPKDALWSFGGVLSDNINNEIAQFNFGNLHNEFYIGRDGEPEIALLRSERAGINASLFLNRDLSFSPGIVYSETIFPSFDSKVTSGVMSGLVINITPLCDHAQGKNKFNYYIHGALVCKNDGSEPKLNSNAPINIKRVGDKTFQFNGKESLLLVDLSSKFSEEIGATIYGEPLMKLRDSLVIDIQHKVATYSSRPGHILL